MTPAEEKEWLLWRKEDNGITASDVSAILTDNNGRPLNPYRGPWTVWADKTGKPPPERTQAEKDRMMLGTCLEPGIANYFQALHFDESWKVETHLNPRAAHPVHSWARGTCDLKIRVPELYRSIGLEIKVVGAHAETAHPWGDPGTDQIPAHVLVQMIWYTFICGYDEWIAAVLFIGRLNNEYQEFRYTRNPELERNIFEAVRDWRERHLIRGEPLPDTGDKNDYQRTWLDQRLEHVNDTEHVVEDLKDEQLFIDYDGTRDNVKTAEENHELVKNRIAGRLADLNCDSLYSHEHGKVSYKQNKNGKRNFYRGKPKEYRG